MSGILEYVLGCEIKNLSTKNYLIVLQSPKQTDKT